MTVAEMVSAKVRRFGPLRFDEVVDLALYDPTGGFYSSGRGSGRRDFITSSEVGPLFGAVVARYLDSTWESLDQPDPFVVIEAGAGSGALARGVLAARPRCSPALRYVVVERSPAWRTILAARLPLEPASTALGSVGRPGGRPVVTMLGEMPAGEHEGVVVANELLDNLAFRLLERAGSGPSATEDWLEVHVGEDLGEVLVPVGATLAARATGLAPDVAPGGRVPLQEQASAWLRSALGGLARGRLLVFDYADSTPSLGRRPWTEWVRTYRANGRGGRPLEGLGEQDITCEVAVDQLAQVRPPASDRSQAEFLTAYGIEEFRSEAQAAWEERAAVGDLQALMQRARVTEASALVDLSGLGGFRALEWSVS